MFLIIPSTFIHDTYSFSQQCKILRFVYIAIEGKKNGNRFKEVYKYKYD